LVAKTKGSRQALRVSKPGRAERWWWALVTRFATQVHAAFLIRPAMLRENAVASGVPDAGPACPADIGHALDDAGVTLPGKL